MHKSFIFTETGIQNRRGHLYRQYADGKMSKFELEAGLPGIVADIIEICGKLPLGSGDSGGKNINILLDIIQHFRNEGMMHNDNIMGYMALIIFNFGFMQGGKAVRNKESARVRKLNECHEHGKTS